jgi:hypothetical protein
MGWFEELNDEYERCMYGGRKVKVREITTHVVDGDTAPQLKIRAVDEKGQGGANHFYEILWNNDPMDFDSMLIAFQNGPIRENGINGVTQEALLAIVIDRLECFQAGPFSNINNETALELTRSALKSLQVRTRERILRGVEGLNVK